MIKLLPVNSSAPPTRTSDNPGENETAEDAGGSEAQRRIAGNDGIIDRPKSNPAACHDGQHERDQEGKIGLLHPDLFDGLLDLGGAVGLEVEDGGLLADRIRHPDSFSWPLPAKRSCPASCAPGGRAVSYPGLPVLGG